MGWKQIKKRTEAKVKDSISLVERRKKNPDRFLFDNKTDVMGQKGIECNGTKGNRRWTHLSFYHSIERATLLVKSYRSKWINDEIVSVDISWESSGHKTPEGESIPSIRYGLLNLIATKIKQIEKSGDTTMKIIIAQKWRYYNENNYCT